ncbi:hypothetical protein BOX15_Mlig031936g2, partial [Macrostomum lignano]
QHFTLAKAQFASMLALPTRLLNNGTLKSALAMTLRRRASTAKLPRGNSEELGFYYRHPGSVTRSQMSMMEGFGAFMWFYVLYHTYHYPQYVIGHPDYPNPRKWTDAELGIPPA